MISKHWQSIIKYMLIPAFCCIIIFAISYKLWNANISIPIFYYGGDDFTHGIFFQRALHGKLNVWEELRMGYPLGQKLYSHPHVPFFAIIWSYFLGIFTNSYGIASNTYYLLTFVLEVYAFMYVAKKVNIKYDISVAGAILFAFSQTHLTANMLHVTESSYFSVPLVFLLCYYIYTGDFKSSKKLYIELMVICLITSAADTFYAFFGCFMLLICTISAMLKKKRKQMFLGIYSILGIAITTFFLLSPSLIHNFINKANVVERAPAEAFYWGLRLISLITPTRTDHPLGWLRRIYQDNSLPEGIGIYLGGIGIIGFIILLLIFLSEEKETKVYKTLKLCSILNLVALLLGLSGGIGFLVSLVITSKVRVYYRVSIYIYFLSIFVVIMILSQNQLFCAIKRRYRILMLSVLVLFHLCDLQIWKQIPDYSKYQEAYVSDNQFVKSIEMSIGEQGKVLVLPYMDYPENLTESGLGNYNRSAMLYLLSDTLYCSTGHVSGTIQSKIMREKIDTDNLDRILYWAYADGFEGIYIDTRAMLSPHVLIENLSILLEQKPIGNTRGDLYFFNIQQMKEELVNTNEVDKTLALFGTGFYEKETNENRYWRWSKQNSKMIVYGEAEKAVFSFFIAGINGQQGELSLKGCGIDQILEINKEYELQLDLSKGKELIFQSTIEPPDLEMDSRDISFGIIDYKIIEE